MPSFLPDTNVLVAAASNGHRHHSQALAELTDRLGRGEEMVLSSHSLVECYSILTRMPPPHRFRPQAAIEAIQGNYIERATVVALTSPQVFALLSSAPARGVFGGRIYDAVIAEVAEISGVDELLTFNVRDFSSLVGRLRVTVPLET